MCTNRVRIHFAAMLSALAIAVTPIAAAQQTVSPVSQALSAIEDAAGAAAHAAISPATGLATFVTIEGGLPVPVLAPLPGTSAAATAARFLEIFGAAFGIEDASQIQAVRSDGPDAFDLVHVRFQQMHDGIPVRGGDIVVHLRQADVVVVQAKTVPRLADLSTTSTLNASDATGIAEAWVENEPGVQSAVLSVPTLEIFDPRLLTGRRSPPKLAWFVEATASDLHQLIWIDADTGSILLDFSNLQDVRERRVYDAQGTSTVPGTLVRSEGDPATGDVDTDDAYDFSGDTYDYFSARHQRDSYDAGGAPLESSVHWFSVLVCPNAFWNHTENLMVYCDGWASADDVVAHEITHAITTHTANLIYYQQPGALNESYSDIFGETVDLTNAAGTDTPDVRWLAGEDLPMGAIRDMADPNVFGDPAKVTDSAYVCDSSDNAGVHSNSGVPNHAYVLMVDGGTFNGITVTPIGMSKAAAIHYRALTTYLTAASDFSDNYDALLQACSDLATAGVEGIVTADCGSVRDALDAVEMTHPPCPEFIVTANTEGSVNVHMNIDGSIGPAIKVGTNLGVNYGDFAVADFDLDGDTDFVAATNETSPRIFYFWRTGYDAFVQRERDPKLGILVATLDPDPKASFFLDPAGGDNPLLAPDYGLGLIAAEFSEGSPPGFIETTNGVFDPGGSNGYWLATGNSHINQFFGGHFNRVDDTFDSGGIFTGWALGISSRALDVDGDRLVDLLVSEQSSGAAVDSQVFLMRGQPDYRFAAPQPVFTTDGHPATYMTLGDFNNDGRVDALAGQDDDGDPGAVFLFLGRGDGTFASTEAEAFDTRPDLESGSDQPGGGSFQAYDADNDGILDILSAAALAGPGPGASEDATLLYYRGQGDGTFEAPVTVLPTIVTRTAFAAPTTLPNMVRVIDRGGDLDNDGDVDVDDVRFVLAARNRPAVSSNDPWDLDASGRVTVLDARMLALMCTRPACRTQ